MPRTSPSASRCSRTRGKIEPLSLLPEMARIATEMVHDVLNAFVERDAEAAVRVCERDKAVDDFYNSIFRTLLTHMMENPHNIGQSAHLLFVAKNIERVGDHATNIAEMVYYAATGQHLGRPPARRRSAGGMTTMAPSACCWSRTTGRSPSWSPSISSAPAMR